MTTAALASARPRVALPAGLRVDHLVLAALSVVGLSLRIAGARGGLWLDEAWSVLLVEGVGTPLGVLVGINHDNNHHLNSLWLLAVGPDAPPLAMRALSIATGTLAIPLAALLARRAGTAAALVTAALFAVSPILVTLGSEARGYAPMVLALLGAALVVDRALADEPIGERRPLLAICALLGVLSQLTMVFGLVALVGWASITWWQRDGLPTAIRRAWWLFAPAAATVAATLALFAAAAWHSPTGFHFGSFERFTWLAWLRAMVEMVGYTVGWPAMTVALPLAAVALLVLAPRLGATRIWFARLTLLGFPLALALLHAANPGHARYYLLAGVALLLLLGEVIGAALARPGRARLFAAAALGTLVAGSLWQDAVLATNRRADPVAAVRVLVARAPAGATVLVERQTGEGVLRVAAAQEGYPLTIATACPAAFAFIDRFGGEAMPATLTRCGATFAPIAAARVRGMSGTHWTLYARQP